MHSSLICLLLSLSLLSMTTLTNCKPTGNTSVNIQQGGCAHICNNNICWSKCGEGKHCIVCIDDRCSEDCALAERVANETKKEVQHEVALTQRKLQDELALNQRKLQDDLAKSQKDIQDELALNQRKLQDEMAKVHKQIQEDITKYQK